MTDDPATGWQVYDQDAQAPRPVRPDELYDLAAKIEATQPPLGSDLPRDHPVTDREMTARLDAMERFGVPAESRAAVRWGDRMAGVAPAATAEESLSPEESLGLRMVADPALAECVARHPTTFPDPTLVR